MQGKVKRISLKDIAEKVGVSVALVSYVLNNRFENRINKEVASRIRKTAAQLQYRPNQIAKSLKTSKTYTIGLVVADIANPFSSVLARIIEDEGARHDYTVIFGSSDENPARFQRLTDTLLNRQVDGLILLPPEGAEEDILRLKNTGIPLVIVDRYFPGLCANYVNVDNFNAAYNAVRLFITNGRKNIGIINYKTGLQHLNDRTKGYLQALTDSGFVFNKQLMKKVDMKNDPDEIAAAIALLLNKPVQADAVLLGSNRIALHALAYIQKMHITIPETVQLISFDETEVFDFFQPQISFVKQPMQQMGEYATNLLLDLIHTGKEKEEKQVFIPANLVARGSTGSELT